MRKAKEKPVNTCQKCGITFVKTTWRKTAKFCSKECLAFYNRDKSLAPRKCNGCGIIKPVDEFYIKKAQRMVNQCVKQPCKECCKPIHASEKVKNQNKARRVALRLEVLERYGNACVCCGDTTQELLCVDHINDDGKQERNSGVSASKFYYHIRRLGFPKDRYQLLCHSCNWGKYHYGVCPHQTKVKEIFLRSTSAELLPQVLFS